MMVPRFNIVQLGLCKNDTSEELSSEGKHSLEVQEGAQGAGDTAKQNQNQ